jgi:maltose alpha-D-glucosyltransferase/alpha-amylase
VAPYNYLYRPVRDGLATTFAGFIAPALEVKDPYAATPEQVKQIARGHLLLAAANALQPGVFGVSSWDLVGALPVPLEAVKDRVGDRDYRWVNRGGVDLLGGNPKAATSAYGIARAKALYGPLPEQLKDPESFASRLKAMLTARKEYRIAEGQLLAVPEPKTAGLCALVLRLPDYPLALTVLNFGREDVTEEINLGDVGQVPPGRWLDIQTGKPGGSSTGGRVAVRIPALSGTLLVLSKER